MYNLAVTTADPQKYPPLVSVAEAAEILGLGRSAVYHLIYRGDIVPLRSGRKYLISLDAIERFLEMAT